MTSAGRERGRGAGDGPAHPLFPARPSTRYVLPMRKTKPLVEFDASPYAHAPTITVSTGITLARALVSACPSDAPSNVKKACKHLAATADAAEGDLLARNRALGAFTEEDSRALDNEADRAWGALRMRLQAMAMIAPEVTPKAARAAELEATLFPNGTGFLAAEYAEQSAAMGTLLRQVEEDELAKSLSAVAGPEFLAAVRRVQPRYEKMVTERLRRDAAVGQNLLETVRALQSAILNHAQKVIGTVEHDDPSTVDVVRAALRPIEAHREANGRAAAPSTESPDPAPAPAAPSK